MLCTAIVNAWCGTVLSDGESKRWNVNDIHKLVESISGTDVGTAVEQRAVGGRDMSDLVVVSKAENPRLTADAVMLSMMDRV
jgi:hypothetical protein